LVEAVAAAKRAKVSAGGMLAWCEARIAARRGERSATGQTADELRAMLRKGKVQRDRG
jgi:hypothetical protein